MTSHVSLLLPDKDQLRRTCKAISVLDAILSPDWEFRYFSYNAHWSEDEEFFEMKDGSGDHLFILFRQEGCVINGFCHEAPQTVVEDLTKGLPPVFNEFIFGEPVKSTGTTFCAWTLENSGWQPAKEINSNCAKELLFIFDGKPETYIAWASEYFEGSYRGQEVSPSVVNKIYREEPLTRDMVMELVSEVHDWDQLQSEMEEIDYLTNLKN